MRGHAGIGLALLMVLGSSLTIAADSWSVDRFTFARPPAPESTVDPKDRLRVDIEHWSSDADRDRVRTAIADNGEERVLDALRDVPRLGTVYWPGGLDYTVRYARRSDRADGGADVVLIVDRPLWMWWDANARTTPRPYSVIQMRLGKDGTGEGRVSLDVAVKADPTFGVALADYAKAPALLADVRRERTSS